MYLRILAMMATCLLVAPAWAATSPLEGHKRRVSHLAVSADGARAITRDSGHGIILWDLTKKVALQTFKKRHWLRVLAISPRGERAISAGPQSKNIWLYQGNNKQVQKLPYQIKWLRNACFVGPNRLLLLGLRVHVLIDLTGKVLATLPKERYTAVASTPDGSTFALATKKEILLYDGKTLKQSGTLPTTSITKKLAFGPRGAQLAAAGKDGEIRIYTPNKAGKWTTKRTLFGHRGAINQIAFINATTLISGRKWFIQWNLQTGQSTTIMQSLWKTRTIDAGGGKLLYPVGKNLMLRDALPPAAKAPVQHGKSVYIKGRPSALLWLPPKLFPARLPMLDGTVYQLVVGDQSGQVHLLQIHFGLHITIQRSSLGKVDGPVNSIALNTRTKEIAIANGNDGEVDIWHLASNKRSTYKVLKTGIKSISYTPDGNALVAGNKVGQIAVFDCRKKVVARQINGHIKLSALQVVGKKELFLVTSTSKYKPMTLSAFQRETVYRRIARYGSAPFAKIHKHGRWAIFGGWRSLKLHDLQQRKERSIKMAASGQSAAIDPGLRIAAASLKKSGNINVYGLTSGKLLQQYQIQWSGLRSLSIAGNGRALAGFRGNRVWLLPLKAPPKTSLDATPLNKLPPWNNTKGKMMARLKGTVHSLAYHTKKKLLYAAGYFDDIAAITPGKKPKSLLGGWGAKYGLALSPDHKWLVSAGKRSLRMSVGNLLTGRATDIPLKGRLRCVTFSPDNKKLAVGDARGKVHIFRTSDWTLTRTLKHGSRRINALAFHPEGQILASSSDDDSLITWDLSTGKKRWRYKANDDINGIEYSPDGNELAAINEDGKAFLLNTHGNITREFKFGNTMLDGYAIGYRPDGRLLAVGFEKGILGIIDRKSGKVTRLNLNWNDIHALTWGANGELYVAFNSLVYQVSLPQSMPKYTPPVRTKGPFVPVHRAKAGQSHFHKASGLLFLARKDAIQVYSQTTGKRSATLAQAPANVKGIAASANADWLAAWSHKHLVVWERKSNKRFPVGTQGKIAAASFHGAFLALRYQDNSTQLYRYDPNHKTKPAAPPAAKRPVAPRSAPAVPPRTRPVARRPLVRVRAVPLVPVKKPVVKKPVVRKPVVRKPAVRKPAVRKPAARRTPARPTSRSAPTKPTKPPANRGDDDDSPLPGWK